MSTTPDQRAAQREAFRTLDAQTLEALHAIALGNRDNAQAARIRIAAFDKGFKQAYDRMGEAAVKYHQEKNSGQTLLGEERP